ncbi:hypothetical protein DL93DRAFT_2165763 [Clavulina sp. PMI_390]|nr:hypothetical protein DL93DRAFT_2165763 [Clavulina sp. PMI_390]
MSPTPPSNDHYHDPLPRAFDTPLKETSLPRSSEQDQPGSSTKNAALAPLPRLQRLLSPNELSYYLPGRAYGANDMCREHF